MPDQNKTNPAQNQPATTTTSPVPPVTDQPKTPVEATMPDFQSAITDIPPMPEDTSTALTAEPTETVGSAAPTDLPPVTPPTQKKKFGGGKVIATILGVLLLVGGIGAGLIITQQRQLFEQQASECVDDDCALTRTVQTNEYRYERSKDSDNQIAHTGPTETQIQAAQLGATGLEGIAGLSQYSGDGEAPLAGDSGGTCRIVSGGTESACDSGLICAGDNICRSSTLITACKNGDVGACHNLCGSATYPDIQTTCVPPGVGCNMDSSQDSKDACSQWHWTNCLNQGTGVNGVGCDVTTKEGNGGDGGDNPTPTPASSASCQNIKAYSTTWTLLTPSQLSALEVGDQVNFCVLGAASEGVFDMARFTINGAVKPDTTTIRPGTTDFCQNYTVPTATTTFNVSAQIHHTTLGWK